MEDKLFLRSQNILLNLIKTSTNEQETKNLIKYVDCYLESQECDLPFSFFIKNTLYQTFEIFLIDLNRDQLNVPLINEYFQKCLKLFVQRPFEEINYLRSLELLFTFHKNSFLIYSIEEISDNTQICGSIDQNNLKIYSKEYYSSAMTELRSVQLDLFEGLNETIDVKQPLNEISSFQSDLIILPNKNNDSQCYFEKHLKYFGDLGGIQKLIKLLFNKEKGVSKQPLNSNHFLRILSILKNVCDYFATNFFKAIDQILLQILDRLLLLSNEQLEKKQIGGINLLLISILQITQIYDLEKTEQYLQNFELKSIQKFFQTNNLSFQIEAINKINDLLETLRIHSFNSSQLLNEPNYQQDYFNKENIYIFLKDSILTKLYSDTIPLKVLENSDQILQFLSQESKLTTELLMMIFESVKGRKKIYKKIVYNLIKSISSQLTLEQLQFLYLNEFLQIKKLDLNDIYFLLDITSNTYQYYLEPLNKVLHLINISNLDYEQKVILLGALEDLFHDPKFPTELKKQILDDLIDILGNDDVTIFVYPLLQQLIVSFKDDIFLEIVDDLFNSKNIINLTINEMKTFKIAILEFLNNKNQLNQKIKFINLNENNNNNDKNNNDPENDLDEDDDQEKNYEGQIIKKDINWNELIFTKHFKYLPNLKLRFEFLSNF